MSNPLYIYPEGDNLMNKKIAFVFPGQGSQTVGMLKELAADFPIVQQTFAEASEELGYDLWQLVQNGPEEKLNLTVSAQPALLAAGVAVWRVWQEQNAVMPVLLAGHSLGEYTALVCAQMFNFKDAVKLVAERGRLMQQAVPEGVGAMAAIVALDDLQIQELCEVAAQDEIVSPANFNAIGQVVIAGHKAAVERAIILAKEKGAKIAKLIPVSVPSHCALMKSAAENLAQYLTNISCHAPKIPVINNVAAAINSDVSAIKNALTQQLYYPVRWVQVVQSMAKQGIEMIIECGPGKVLAGLNKRIEASISTLSVNDPQSLKNALDSTH